MRLNKYEKFQQSEDVFWFISTGKSGSIIKGVVFQEMDEPNRYNLAMGDFDPETGIINDEAVSNNYDVRKVFATVAEIVQDYTATFPEKEIFVSGNTSDKKHAYSFVVSFFLEEITEDFEIWGAYIENEFEPFMKDRIYDAILVKRIK